MQIYTLVKRLTKCLFNIDDHGPLKQFLKLTFTMLKANGTLYTIRYFKQARLHITRYMVGKPLYSNNARVSLTAGFPTRLIFLKGLIDSGRLSRIKFVLTLLNIPKCIKPKKDEELPISYDSITDPFSGPKEYTIPVWFIKKFIMDNNLYAEVPKYSLKDFYLSMKSSPSGPALISAWTSIVHTNYYMLQTFLNFFHIKWRYYVKTIYRNVLLDDFFNKFYTFSFNNYDQLPKKVYKDKDPCYHIGKLAVIEAPEGKMRVIATLDYFSQVILKPIHDEIFRNLRKFPQDRTFTQDPWNDWEENDSSFWSLDLTAATDRFPVKLEAKVLKYLFRNEDLSRNWLYLLIERDYALPHDFKQSIRYSVGQPMGAYSSWGAFTLSHHLVVAWAAHLCQVSNFRNYILLGDDIVIKDDRIAKKYISIMHKLGVSISESKTHVSKTTYEFAKRWIRGKDELTGLPLNGLLDNINNYKVVINTLYDYCIRRNNLWLYKGSLCDLIINLYFKMKLTRVVKDTSRSKRKFKMTKYYLTPRFLRRKVRVFVTILHIAYDQLSYDQWRNFIGSYLIENEQYVIPKDNGVGLSVLMKGILSKGMVGLAQSANNRSLNLYNQIKTYSIEKLNIEDINDLYYQPFFHAIYNQVEGVENRLRHYLKSDNYNIIDSLDYVTYIDFDTLTSFRRNNIIFTSNLDRLFNNSLNLLRRPVEAIYYGSSLYTHSEFDFEDVAGSTESTSQWCISIEINQRKVYNELLRVRNRQVMPDPPTLTPDEQAAAIKAAFAAFGF